MSNIDKINVKGSTEALLEEIDEYFDISKTSPYETPNELVDKIISIVSKEDIVSFLPKMMDKMKQRYDGWNNRHFEFIDAIFKKYIAWS